MKDLLSISPNLSKPERIQGWVYYAISVILLPPALLHGNAALGLHLNEAQLNFLLFAVNFVTVCFIFHRFLKLSLRIASRIVFMVVWYGMLGFLGNRALGSILSVLLYYISPGFANVNDMNIAAMASQDRTLMILGTVFLVPVAEELFYRGLMFRWIYSKKRTAAYLASMGVFALVHVVGYIGVYEPLTLLLCFLQYLPAGYCLAWCYQSTGTIVTPIVMHMIVNGYALYYMR